MAPSSSIVSKIKVQLKLSISRLRMVQQKDTAIAKQQRRAMAQLLEQGKEESARIRVENIIRSDITTELHEILELYCELLLARTGLLESHTCDPGLEEAIKSIIYAAPRTDIKELQAARALLVEKYGKEFALEAIENRDGKVAERVLRKLRVEPPAGELVTLYLREIANTYGVNWPRDEKSSPSEEYGDDDDEDEGGEGGGGGGGQKAKSAAAAAVGSLEEPLTTEELSRATPPRDFGGPKSPVSIVPPSPSTDNVQPRVKVPGSSAPPLHLKPNVKMNAWKKKQQDEEGGGGGTSSSKSATEFATTTPSASSHSHRAAVGGKIPDVDELAKRFAALKR